MAARPDLHRMYRQLLALLENELIETGTASLLVQVRSDVYMISRSHGETMYVKHMRRPVNHWVYNV